MKRTAYTFGAETFATQREAKDRIKLILNAYPLGATLSDVDAAFMADVLSLHPERDAKVGVGVTSMQVEQNEGSRGFWLTRVDGSRTDFSYIACLSAPTHKSDVMQAMRSEVRSQIERFKMRRSYPHPCAITGEMLELTQADVDHASPLTFDKLASTFIEWMGIEVKDVAVLPTEDGSTRSTLADPVLAAAWAGWHQEHARLRIVARNVNRGMLRRGVRR